MKIGENAIPITKVSAYQDNNIFSIRIWEYPMEYNANNKIYFFQRIIDGNILDLFAGQLCSKNSFSKNGGDSESCSTVMALIINNDYNNRVLLSPNVLESIIKDDNATLDLFKKLFPKENKYLTNDYKKVMQIINMYNTNKTK
jgi:hypothetical protein